MSHKEQSKEVLQNKSTQEETDETFKLGQNTEDVFSCTATLQVGRTEESAASIFNYLVFT